MQGCKEALRFLFEMERILGMPKSANQKLKLLYLLKIFHEKTDESHCLSAAELAGELSAYDIRAERKSIYDDVECLIQAGYDIVYVKAKKGGGYYLASREFELPELKLLVDAVQASRFITQKKSRELISKIEKLAGPYEGKQLQRQVYVAGRVKTENESIYYNVDRIHHAIQENAPISFGYLEWNVKKELQPRREGKVYRISPWALAWQDENYYLVGYDEEAEKIKHFRVDKMLHIEMLPEKREGREVFQEFDMAVYERKMFGMFDGREENVKLLCDNAMAGIMIDRFGKNVPFLKKDAEHFMMNVKVAVSRQFFSWVMGLGSGIQIIGPVWVVDEMKEEIRRLSKQYLQENQHESGITGSDEKI